MKKYECDYKGKVRHYRANSAMEAVDKFSRQNHIRVSVVQIDQATQGCEFARGWAYGNGNTMEWIDMSIVKSDKEVA